MRIGIALLSAVLCAAWAQDVKFPPGLDKLAAKAEESVDVTLDGAMLGLAGRFMSEDDADQARAKRLIAGLKGIYVRSFEFAKEGEYNMADIDAFKAQFQAPAWSRMVGVKSRGESTDIYLRLEAGGDVGGLVIIAAEPTELTIVNIVGRIRPEDIGALGGQFGIPNLKLGTRRYTGSAPTPPSPPAKKGQDEE